MVVGIPGLYLVTSTQWGGACNTLGEKGDCVNVMEGVTSHQIEERLPRNETRLTYDKYKTQNGKGPEHGS